MKIKGEITLLFNEEGLHIELRDEKASIKFADIKLNQEQTCQALSRLAMTDCEIEVQMLENVGKEMEDQLITFPLPKEVDYSNRKEIARKEADRICQEGFKGWISDGNFSSRGSFLIKDGKEYAQTRIKRWI